MELRGIDFGSAWVGSGSLGFFGEGYWFHPIHRAIFWKRFCPKRLTFVAKTTTLNPRRGKKYGEEGNMELAEDGISPKHWFPDCIVVGIRGFFGGYALNAVGLSGPGAHVLFADGRWQARTQPFFISFMSLAEGAQQFKEAEEFRACLHDTKFHAPVGMQINVSCVNAKANLKESGANALRLLDIFADSDIPRVVKINTHVSVELARRIAEHPACDALQVTNTILFGTDPLIPWKKLFPSGKSPLAKYGGGGISGRPLLPVLCEWLLRAQDAGIPKPINAGGGILHPRDVDLVHEVAPTLVQGVSIATALMNRPRQVGPIITRAEELWPTEHLT